jgi:PAS domain S-box-containing protein
MPLALLRGSRRGILVGLLIANNSALIVAEYLHPSLPTPFQRPADRVLDLVSGLVCASLTLAAVLWLVLSIHAHKHALLKTLSARLAASERGYRDLVENASTAIFRLTTDGRIEFCNRFAEEFFALSRENVAGKGFIEAVIPEQLKLDAPWLESLHTLVESPGQGATVETRHDSRNGETTWMSWTSQPIYDDVQRLSGVLCIGTDMTAHKRAEEQRRRYADQLTQIQRLESVGVLAGGIAHDFNNYLTGILGNISLLKESLGENTEAREIAAAVENASLQTRGLTQQLLTFAKGGAPLRAPTAVTPLVRTSVSLALRGKSVASTVDLAPDCWPVLADAGQMGQVLNNLLINAHQAMPSGGNIRIQAHNVVLAEGNALGITAGNYVQVAVTDTGVGIAKENLARIFDPYFTTKSVGSGLGLAVVFSIVRQHGGTIRVDSEVGRGSTFTVLLPAATGCAADPKEPPARKGPMGVRILLVDDEPMVRDTASRLLKKANYVPVTASEGREALRLYEEAYRSGSSFAVVVMDLTIPGGMGGKEAIRRLLEIDPKAKAIVSSGYAEDPVVANYQAHGFIGVVTKPYTASEMLRALGKALADEA